jgi:hypothetical protein
MRKAFVNPYVACCLLLALICLGGWLSSESLSPVFLSLGGGALAGALIYPSLILLRSFSERREARELEDFRRELPELALDVLEQLGHVSASYLSELFGQDVAVIVAVLKALEQAGLARHQHHGSISDHEPSRFYFKLDSQAVVWLEGERARRDRLHGVSMPAPGPRSRRSELAV